MKPSSAAPDSDFDEADALAWIRKALTKTHNKLQPFVLGRVSGEVITKAATLGINLNHHQLALDYDGVRHSYIKHGNPLVETKRGQRAIVAADFLRIGSVLDQGILELGEPPTGRDGTARLKACLQPLNEFNGCNQFNAFNRFNSFDNNETAVAVFSVRKKLVVLHTLWVKTSNVA